MLLVNKRFYLAIGCGLFGVALAGLLFSTAGCGVRSSVKELTGTYDAKYQYGSERLALNGDGTFTQVYTPLENKPSTTNSGSWELLKPGDAILLTDVLEFDQWGQGEKPSLKKIIWRIRIAKRFGKVSLIIDGDRGLEYEKADRVVQPAPGFPPN
jgi:hypothetical protein